AAARTLARLHGPAKAPGPATLQIRYGRVGRPEQFDEERYSLRVTPVGVSIDAPTSLGVLRALATLEQLATTGKRPRYLPEVDIQDRPRFAWRGLSLDAARHFLPVAVIKRNLDGMAAVKLNVLHWHLTDDQGFRVESKVLPRLHQVGSADGLYYTQAQVREVLAYAAARGIRVVPEFDVPSHTTSWIVAYPRLASSDSVYAPYQLWRTTNVALDPTRETTYSLLDSLFTEMTALFPDPYFHIGGDENDGREWRRSPRIVAYMRAHGMVKADSQTVDKHQLQTYFNRRVLAMMQRLGKTMVGWDEILGPDLPKQAVIQSWRGKKGLNDAARLGHPVLLSSGYYLDLNYPAASHYAADPLPPDTPLTPAEQQLGEGAVDAALGALKREVLFDDVGAECDGDAGHDRAQGMIGQTGDHLKTPGNLCDGREIRFLGRGRISRRAVQDYDLGRTGAVRRFDGLGDLLERRHAGRHQDRLSGPRDVADQSQIDEFR
ncbi:MAG: family 20 glycosylhydrolase, partial [Chitinophagaceae bacterium]|nr:family 20 glycosylhydrolase [Rubrivivax sp.]